MLYNYNKSYREKYMNKILIFVILVSYINAETVLTKEVIYDGILNGAKGLVKEIVGVNDKKHEENCQIEYKKLRAKNSKLLAKEQHDNTILRGLANRNSIKFEEVRIKNLQVRKNRLCSIEYWDYFKATNHLISKIGEENRMLKVLLQRKNLNYTPLLKVNSMEYIEDKVNDRDRENAKADLKKQLSL